MSARKRRQSSPDPESPRTEDPEAPAAPSPIVLRLPDGTIARPANRHRLFRYSQYWTYVVSNRQRLNDAAKDLLRDEARDHLAQMGIDDAFLAQMAEAGVVEVDIEFTEESRGWEQRTMPWESVLSLATKRWRGESHLCVVRRLRPLALPEPIPGELKTAMVVASNPGRIGEVYGFESERRLFAANFESLPGRPPVLQREALSEAELRGLVAKRQPGVIHLSGVDAHQGAELLGWPTAELHDGFILAGPSGEPVAVEADPLAAALTADGSVRPRLVAFNCLYSGARLAALAVARGAQASIGFQDTIDDAGAEQFYAAFYSRWRESGWYDLLGAFGHARAALASTMDDLPAERRGGDVVLWTASGLPQPSAPPLRGAEAPRKAPRPLRQVPPDPAKVISVEVKPVKRLNYSLLHNDRSPFELFSIYRSDASDQPLEVGVEVQLNGGECSIPYRSVVLVKPGITDMGSRIRLPLVAGLFARLRESVQTTMSVEVTCGGKCLHLDAYRVVLLPTNEWTDDDRDRKWLPSFVLPRDTAVGRVIDGAPRYLRALADDSSAGFDGYQRLAPNGDDPDGVVDNQVKAIWSAMLYDTPLGYINPPPTYSPKAQRIRTPGEILSERQGTCLDLALFFASCLEYVGLLPGVFLLQGHAFPGYWRSPQARLRLFGFQNFAPAKDPPATEPRSVQQDASRGWVFGTLAFHEIVTCLQEGGLVPIETTALTRRGSFAGALETGMKNLVTGWNFDAYVDLQAAREVGVTPLPLFGLQQTPPPIQS